MDYLTGTETKMPEGLPKPEMFNKNGRAFKRLLHENFFSENQGTLKGMDCHEIAMCFLMKSKGAQELHSDSYTPDSWYYHLCKCIDGANQQETKR